MTGSGPNSAWQLQVFDRSLKKKQKLRLLLGLVGPLEGKRCLLVTCGDNNGALNHHFRAAGGRWTWADLEGQGLGEMSRFLGEPVLQVRADAVPFQSSSFDCVIAVDVHEHLEEVSGFNRELARILSPGGIAAVTTPNGDPRLPVARLKRWTGMSPAVYGHVVQGYLPSELAGMLEEVGLEVEREGAYSRFFTELAELAINFVYVKVLSRRGKSGEPAPGSIAPDSEEELRAVGRSFRLYSRLYPLVRAFSALDALIPGRGGYAVAVAGRKPPR